MLKMTQFQQDRRKHVLKRVQQRFPHIYNQATPGNIIVALKSAAIQAKGKKKLVKVSSKSRNNCLVRVFNTEMIVVYDHHHNFPITVFEYK